MPRKVPSGLSRYFRDFIRRALSGQERPVPRNTGRRLRLEQLEGRRLLASDLGVITGIVTHDTPVDGATINLYLDDGDGIFEPTGDDGPTADATTTTDAAGTYVFDQLAAGDYWIEQEAQTVGSDTLAQIARLVTISAAAADGVAGDVIDDFADTLPPSTVIATDVLNPASGTFDHLQALGDERDLIVSLVGPGITSNGILSATGNVLSFSTSSDVSGTFTAVYDGDDNDADTLDPVGLVGLDLTDGGVNTAIKIRAAADLDGASVTLRVHTDGTNFSESDPIDIPGGNTPEDFVFHFADFNATGGTGADFTSVGAIEMVIVTTANGTDGSVTLLGAFGPGDEVTENIDNEANLSLTKTLDTASPTFGQPVTFTLTLTNPVGGADATGIAVTDTLPPGLTLISSNPQQGTFVGGVWDVGTLAAGSSTTLEIVATVETTSLVTNAASITALDQFDPDTNNNSDSVDVDAPAAADLELSITPPTQTPNLGANATFTLTLTNGGPDAATNITVTDVIPAGLVVQSSDPDSGTTYASNVWTILSLASGASVTLEIVAQVNDASELTYSAQVTASDVADPDSTPNDGAGDDFASVTVDAIDPVASADLSLTITPPTQTPNLGANATFTLTLTNGGPDTATNITVTDVIPAGLVVQSSDPDSGTTYASNVWTILSLASGASVTLEIVAQVNDANLLTYSAQVTASDVADPDSTPNNNVTTEDDQASVTVDAVTPTSADLSLAITPPTQTPNVGQNATFLLTLTNSGPDAATNITVTDVIPAGMVFQSANAASGTNYASSVWTIPGLASGANVTLEVVARVDVNTPLTYSAQVTASDATDPDSTPNDNTGDDRATATVDAPDTPTTQADLSVTVTPSSTTPNFGSTVTFTIEVANAGPDQATGVVVRDQLPTGLQFVSATATQGAYVSGTGLWTVGTLASGANATLTLVARVNTTAAVNNVAQVTASGVADPDSTPNNNVEAEDDQQTVTIDAPAAADLRLAKTIVGQAFVNVGENLTFRLTLTNSGPDGATGVVVNDDLPAGLTFVSATASQGTYDSTTGLWTVGSVANGATVTLDIVATLTTAGAKNNTASIDTSNEFDPDTADRQSSVGAGSTRLSKRMFLARE